MSITKDEVRYVAKLARLNIAEDKLEPFTAQMDNILGYIDQLNELDVTDVQPTAQSLSSGNVLREDIVDNTYTRERSLKNAPLEEDGFFKVPKVIDEEA
jgi:aspartyl-tRNA(Asn)/glutamyl-tRNA(Gln) amidotransferase subunit C